MNKKIKSKLLLGMVIILAMGLSLCACGGGGDAEEPMTIEKYAAEHSDFQDQLNSYSEEDDSVVVTAEGNDLVFSYDVAKLGLSEEMAKSDTIKASLDEELDKQAETFESTAKTISSTTGVEGVNVVVKYLYGEDEICTRSFSGGE